MTHIRRHSWVITHDDENPLYQEEIELTSIDDERCNLLSNSLKIKERKRFNIKIKKIIILIIILLIIVVLFHMYGFLLLPTPKYKCKTCNLPYNKDFIGLPSIELHFHPNEKYYPTDYYNLNDDNIVYLGQSNYCNEKTKRKFLAYSFQFFYNENPSPCDINCLDMGYHKYDIERLLYLQDIDNKEQFVYFSAHRNMGVWIKEKIDENHPIIAWVALNSHAMIPKPKTRLRYYGFANDRVSMRGKQITYDKENIIFLEHNIKVSPETYHTLRSDFKIREEDKLEKIL